MAEYIRNSCAQDRHRRSPDVTAVRRFSVIWRALLVCLFICYGEAHAAAWTLPQGRKQIIETLSVYEAKSFFDNAGNTSNRPRYTKFTLENFGEIGVRDDLTLGLVARLHAVREAVVSGDVLSAQGIGDTALHARYRLWENRGAVVSVQPRIILPAPDDTAPETGSRTFQAELRGLAGASFQAWERDGFVNLEAAYRHRAGRPHNQFQLDATLGWRPSPEWLLMPQIFATVRANSPDRDQTAFSLSNDYSLATAQFSTVYHWQEDIGVQVGAFADIEGRNTGRGKGMRVALWIDF